MISFFRKLFLLSLCVSPLVFAEGAANPIEAWKEKQNHEVTRGPAAPPQAIANQVSQSANTPPNMTAPAPLGNGADWGLPPEQQVADSAPPPPDQSVLPSTETIVKRVKPNRPLTYEESQEVMLNSAPDSKVPQAPGSEQAFEAMLAQNMPLSPRQVIGLRQQIDLAQRVAIIPAVVPPKPVSTTLMINLAPGTTPPAIRLASGYVSSLVFVDSTGSPWPIDSFDIGNPKSVNIQWDGKSNILLLQAISAYSNGDIVVRLVGLPTPVTMELVAGQRVVDYRVDLHVPGLGPNTKDLPTASTLPGSANQLLLGVLDGVAPAGSKLLMVKGADCQAWQLGDYIYLRTRLTILSPGWIGKMVSPDGMQAYELPKTSSVLVSRFGEPAELKVEGF